MTLLFRKHKIKEHPESRKNTPPDITNVTPDRKDHHYVGKVDGKSQYVQKQCLMWTFNDLSKGSSLIKNESSFEFSFGKKIKFHQLYEYIKSNREYV